MADGDLDDPVDYGSIVRNNLMKRPGYTPYCGETHCFNRTSWDGEQFRCRCGYRTEFPEAFLSPYRVRRDQMRQQEAPQPLRASA